MTIKLLFYYEWPWRPRICHLGLTLVYRNECGIHVSITDPVNLGFWGTATFCTLAGSLDSLNFNTGKKLDLKVNLGVKATSVRPGAKSLTWLAHLEWRFQANAGVWHSARCLQRLRWGGRGRRRFVQVCTEQFQVVMSTAAWYCPTEKARGTGFCRGKRIQWRR